MRVVSENSRASGATQFAAEHPAVIEVGLAGRHRRPQQPTEMMMPEDRNEQRAGQQQGQNPNQNDQNRQHQQGQQDRQGIPGQQNDQDRNRQQGGAPGSQQDRDENRR